MNSETMRKRVRHGQVRAGVRPGATREELEEVKRLKREVAELRRANEILQTASAFRRSARPDHDEMIAFVDCHKGRFGVEPICRALRATAGGFLTSRGYRAAKTRPASARAARDELLAKELVRVHAENYSVYGVRKMAAAMRREGWELGGDQTARPCPEDLVNRRFRADAPNRLWVADITYVPTWQGFAYVAFVTDAFSRRIAGWAVSATLRT